MSDIQFRRSQEALHADVGEDIVALHVRNGRCFGMEHVTADVWRALGEPATAEQICARLLEEYEVDPETCRADVADLLEAMHQEGLIEAIPRQENGH